MADIKIASTSVKELKEAIRDLRGEMIQLDKNSQEYKDTAKDVNAMQAKLNEVMKDTKGTVEATEGSFNALNQQLAKLKDEWKATGDEVRRAQLTEQINAVKEKMNSMNESIGNYQHNVGNYANSFTQAFEAMGISVGKLPVAFNLATAATGKFNAALNVLKAHPVIAVISAVVGIFMAIKKAIGESQEATLKWNKAMSAFQPVLNVFKRALGYLAEGLATVALWLSDKLPDALGYVGKGMKWFINIVADVVKGWSYLPKAMAWIWEKIIDIVGKGVGWVAEKIGGLLDSIGIENKITEWGNSMKNFSSNLFKSASGILDGFVNSIRKAGTTVDEFFKRSGKAVDNSLKRQQEQNDLIVEQQQLTKDVAASELKQQQLLREAYTKTGSERKKLLQEYEKEVDRIGKRQLEYAKREESLAYQLAALSPTSVEGNKKLAELTANVSKVQKDIENAKKRSTRMITSLNEQEMKSDEAKTTKAKTEAEKRAKIAEAEARKKAQAAFGDYNSQISSISSTTKGNTDKLNADAKLLQELGKMTITEESRIENERYRIAQEGNEKIIATYRQMVEDTVLLEEQREDALRKLNSALLQTFVEETNHRTNIEKLNKKDLTDLYNEEINDIKDRESKVKQELQQSYNDRRTMLLDSMNSGDISYAEYLRQSENLNREYQDNLSDMESQGAQERLNAQYQEWQNAITLFGEQSTIALDLHKAYEEMKTQVTTDEVNKRVQTEEREAKLESDTKKKLVKSIRSTMSQLFDIYEEDLRAQVEAGEITEEQAEERFQMVKQIQTATAILDVLSASLGIWSGYLSEKTIPAYLRLPLAIANQAAVLASGWAQIREIQNTSFGSTTGGSSSNGISMASATPLLNQDYDIAQMTTLSATGDSEKSVNQRVYIVQSDIVSSDSQVQARVNQTTF